MKLKTVGVPPLSQALVMVALCGWGAKPLDGSRADATDLFEAWIEGSSGVGIARVWLQHETFLRAEARRLGIAPQERIAGRAGRVYFGEWCAAPEDQRLDDDVEDDGDEQERA